VKTHQNELGKISGVLVHDSGTGKVLTIGLMANYNVRETIDRALISIGEKRGFRGADFANGGQNRSRAV